MDMNAYQQYLLVTIIIAMATIIIRIKPPTTPPTAPPTIVPASRMDVEVTCAIMVSEGVDGTDVEKIRR